MFIKVRTEEQIETVARLAHTIWREYFNAMIGSETIEYMIRMFQSEPAISHQMQEEGYSYYLIQPEQDAVGYFAICPKKEKKELFLSKLYLLSSQRGKGYGKQAMQFLETLARDEQFNKITLTVFHKNQKAIQAYERMGFQHTGAIMRDIGKDIIIHDLTYQMDISL